MHCKTTRRWSSWTCLKIKSPTLACRRSLGKIGIYVSNIVLNVWLSFKCNMPMVSCSSTAQNRSKYCNSFESPSAPAFSVWEAQILLRIKLQGPVRPGKHDSSPTVVQCCHSRTSFNPLQALADALKINKKLKKLIVDLGSEVLSLIALLPFALGALDQYFARRRLWEPWRRWRKISAKSLSSSRPRMSKLQWRAKFSDFFVAQFGERWTAHFYSFFAWCEARTVLDLLMCWWVGGYLLNGDTPWHRE